MKIRTAHLFLMAAFAVITIGLIVVGVAPAFATAHRLPGVELP